jgi:dTMP kinase
MFKYCSLEKRVEVLKKMDDERRGAVFSFEGLDYAGKSTQIKMLEDRLRNEGYPVSDMKYYEPGGTLFADIIRAYIKRTIDTPYAQTVLAGEKETIESTEMSPMCQALAFFTARSHQVNTKLKKDVEQGNIVLLDRSIDSTTVYQGHAQDPSLVNWIRETNDNIFATAGFPIIKTFYLDISVGESLRRKQEALERTGQEADRFESKGKEFLEKLRDGYLQEYSHSQRQETGKRIQIIEGYEYMKPMETRINHIHKTIYLSAVSTLSSLGIKPKLQK